jgi:hypothetical protein
VLGLELPPQLFCSQVLVVFGCGAFKKEHLAVGINSLKDCPDFIVHELIHERPAKDLGPRDKFLLA